MEAKDTAMRHKQRGAHNNELREKMSELVKKMGAHAVQVCPAMLNGVYYADKILALIKEAGYVKLAKDQTAPGNRYANCYGGNDPEVQTINDTAESSYHNAQEDMLKAGWRKVELSR